MPDCHNDRMGHEHSINNSWFLIYNLFALLCKNQGMFSQGYYAHENYFVSQQTNQSKTDLMTDYINTRSTISINLC